MGQPERGDLTLHEVAAHLGVHYNTVYRYVRRGRLPARQEGGEWRVSTDDLAAFDAEPPRRGRRGQQDFQLHQERLLRRLIDGDVEGSWDVVTASLDAGADPVDVHVRLLGPTMAEIGERWARGDLGIHHEHRATAVTNLLLGRMSTRFTRRGRRRGRVVLGAAPDDQHSLAVAMMADVLRASGYDAVDLGADVPPDSFATAVADADRLIAVALYSGAPDNDAAVAATLSAIRGVAPAGVTVIVGGPGIGDADRAAELGADLWAATAQDVLDAVEASDSPGSRAAS